VIQEILPVYDLNVRFQVPSGKRVKQVAVQPAGLTLHVTADGEWMTVCVPKVWVHEAVVVDWAD
jgi:hypothetical protein